MKKIKIAVIAHSPHTDIGGSQNYNKNIYNIFKNENIEFNEFPIEVHDSKQNINSKVNGVKIDYSLVNKNINNKKIINQILINHDLVIVSIDSISKGLRNKDNVIMIQHTGAAYYTNFPLKPFYPRGFYLIPFIHGIIELKILKKYTLGNPFKYMKNIIFHFPETTLKTSGNIFYIPLTSHNKNEIKISQKGRSFIWLARLNFIKGPKFLYKIFKKKNNINIYGDGPFKNYFQKKFKNNFKGKLLKKDVNKKIQNSVALLLTSRMEGAAYTIIEALSNGKPVILFDTFQAVKFYKKCKAVFVIKPYDINAYVKAMKYIEDLSEKEYQKLSQEAVNFAKKELTMEIFEQRWKEVINTVIENNKKIK